MSYRDEVLKNVNGHLPEKDYLAMGGMGIAEEAGEVAGLIKKHLFQKAPLDRQRVIKELGDVRWYMEFLCHVIGTTIEEVESVNVAKLRERFPNGFTPEDSIVRRDEK